MNLESVKPGDKIYYRYGWGRHIRIITVTKVTRTQVICEKEKFNVLTGRSIGASYKVTAMLITDEILQEVKLMDCRLKVADFVKGDTFRTASPVLILGLFDLIQKELKNG